MEVDSEEISEYIKSVLEAVKRGVPTDSGYFVSGTVKIRLGVRNESAKGGALKGMVVSVGGKRAKEENASIEFEVTNPMNTMLKESWENVLKGFAEWQKR